MCACVCVCVCVCRREGGASTDEGQEGEEGCSVVSKYGKMVDVQKKARRLCVQERGWHQLGSET